MLATDFGTPLIQGFASDSGQCLSPTRVIVDGNEPAVTACGGGHAGPGGKRASYSCRGEQGGQGNGTLTCWRAEPNTVAVKASAIGYNDMLAGRAAWK